MPGDAILGSWFDRLFAAMHHREFGQDLRLNNLVGEFLVHRRSRGRKFGRLGRAQGARRRSSRPCERTRVEDGAPSELSAVADLSASQTRRLFRKHLRVSPREWLQRERLTYAQSLMTNSDATLAQIAGDLRLLRRLSFQS